MKFSIPVTFFTTLVFFHVNASSPLFFSPPNLKLFLSHLHPYTLSYNLFHNFSYFFSSSHLISLLLSCLLFPFFLSLLLTTSPFAPFSSSLNHFSPLIISALITLISQVYLIMACVIVALGVMNTAMSSACARLADADQVPSISFLSYFLIYYTVLCYIRSCFTSFNHESVARVLYSPN